ncbi:MAG: hypothetical protein LC803_22470 [Acidobacteria bacterium]|nr:hypothetical protein [Acidobacteriota bacterium]
MYCAIRRSLYFWLASFVLVSLAHTTQAQAPACPTLDPVCVDKEHYRVVYEDADIRVLRYRDKPGHFVPEHSHPEYVVYSYSPATRQFLPAPCTSKPAPISIPVDTPFVKPPVTHCERNTGTTDTDLIVIEFKAKSNPTPAAKAPKRRANRSIRRTSR